MIGSYHIQINSISLTFCGRGKKTWEQLQEEGEGERAANVQVSSSIHFFSHIFLHDETSQVVVMLRKGGKAATTKGITVSADSMLGEQV